MRANWYLGASFYLEIIALFIDLPKVDSEAHSRDMQINHRLSLH